VELVGRRFLDAALRIRGRLPSFKGTGAAKKMYLCHRFCETGALPLSKGLAEVRGFLVAHPTHKRGLREAGGLHRGASGDAGIAAAKP
jgi:hypothetical protein